MSELEFFNYGDVTVSHNSKTWRVKNLSSVTGWASYKDTAYTDVSPFTITQGNTSILPNNAGTVIDTHLPQGIESFYNATTRKITPENVGDYYIFTIRFKALNSNNAGWFDFGIDIGGSLGIIFKETFLFHKGTSTTHEFSIDTPGYTLDTFIANGGQVKLYAGLGDLDVWGIEYQITRVHKANV